MKKLPDNKKVFDSMVALIEDNKDCEQSTEDKLLSIAVYGDKNGGADVRVSVNGFTPVEVDVIVREIYSRVYDIRARKTKSGKALEKKLSKEKNG